MIDIPSCEILEKSLKCLKKIHFLKMYLTKKMKVFVYAKNILKQS